MKFRSIGIAIAMCFLFGMISSSDEDIEIVELRSYNNTSVEYSYDGETYFTFYVRTNEPYGGMLCYVDGIM